MSYPAYFSAPAGGDVKTRQPSRCRLTLLVLIMVCTLLSVIGAAMIVVTRPRMPEDTSAEAGFARDMTVHHAQAVEMAELIRERTANPTVAMLAMDIALTQQAQIGQMRGWLDVWGLPVTAQQPPMAWMGMDHKGPMPGMASRAELSQLAGLNGSAADALFLQLMIEHHQAGVDMAEAVLKRSQRSEVRWLAQAMATSQQSEIAAMRDLLAAIPTSSSPEAGSVNDQPVGHSEESGHST
jgi:uncharacterized protein (DUF305 family)